MESDATDEIGEETSVGGGAVIKRGKWFWRWGCRRGVDVEDTESRDLKGGERERVAQDRCPLHHRGDLAALMGEAVHDSLTSSFAPPLKSCVQPDLLKSCFEIIEVALQK